MTNPLQKHLDTLTAAEREDLARKAGSSPGAIRLAAAAYRTAGRLALSPEFAARLSTASGCLSREQLSPTCATCPYSPKDEKRPSRP